MTSIAVIGAGLAGSIAAHSLQKSAKVTVFEKSGRAGGRMSTRRVDTYRFNHGAQFFTARNPQFKDFLEPYIEQGIVAQWNPQNTTLDPLDKPFKRIWYEPHYVGTPGMSALAGSLAEDLDVRYHCEIGGLEATGETWQLRDTEHNDYGEFDWVISAIPSAQALNILGSKIQQHAEIADVVFSPCFSLMLGLKNKPTLGFDAAVVKNSPISWLAQTHSEQANSYGLVIHSDNAWAKAHIDDEKELLQEQLFTSAQELLSNSLQDVQYAALHRWLYAKVETSAQEDYLIDRENRLAVCGEWCRGNRVEDAFLSGFKLAEFLKTQL